MNDLRGNQMTPRLTTITPDMAVDWLERCNGKNRPVNKRRVQIYASDMANGRWELTNQGIAFGPNEQLLDGQHRLWAIVESGVSVHMYVFYNMSSKAQLVIDQGGKRNAKDAITLQGDMGRITHHEMSTLRAMLRGRRPQNLLLSLNEERDALFKHSDAIAFAVKNLSKRTRQNKGLTTSIARGVIARAWYSHDPADLERFCEVLQSSFGKEDRDKTVIVLRNAMTGSYDGSANGAAAPVERWGKFERGLYAYLNGEVLSKIYAAPKELFLLPGEDA